MYKYCQTEASSRRQRSIENGMLELMLNRSYEEITVSELCKFLNIPRNTFYRYFDAKDDVVNALIDNIVLDFCPKLSRNGQLEEMERFFDYWFQNRNVLDVIQRNGLGSKLIDRFVRQGHDYFDDGMYRIIAKDTATQKHLTQFAYGGVMTMILHWHHSGCQESPKEMAHFCFQIFTQPIFSQDNL